MAQQTDAATEAIDDPLADCVKAYGIEEGETGPFADFIEAGLEEARDMVEANLSDAKRMGKADDSDDVESVLNAENVREVNWEASRFGGRRITVWLRDAPVWANTADCRSFTVGDLNARNRKVRAVIDVRPF